MSRGMPSVRFRLDTSRMKRKVRTAMERTRAARTAALSAALKPVVRQIDATIDRDTNRLGNAHAQAANKAGLGPIAIRPLKKSRYRGQNQRRLEAQVRVFEQQVKFWEDILRVRYDQQSRGGKYRAQAQRKLNTVRKRLARAKEELAKLNDTALVIGRRSKSGLTATVRDKVYGGDGKLIEQGERSFYVLHAKEPHSTIVEKKKGAVKKALAAARVQGVRRAHKAYLAKLGIG